MKIIFFRLIGSYLSVLLLLSFLSFSVSISQAAEYDDFNGAELDLTLWDIHGDGSDIENASIFNQSDGFLHTLLPADIRFVKLFSKQEFSGDLEFVLDFRDFQTNSDAGGQGPPSHSLTLEWENSCLLLTIYHQDNQNYLGSAYCNDPNGFSIPTSANSGLLKITRLGSNMTTSYDTGAGWVALGTFSEVFTGEVRVALEFQTGSDGSMQVSSDFLVYEDQPSTPIDPGPDPEPEPEPEPDINVAPPENLTSSVDGSAVSFSWSNVSDSDGYRLYFGISPGNYIDFVELNGITSLAATDVPAGNYYLAITAYSGSSESGFSNEVNVFIEEVVPVEIVIPAPQNFVASVDEDTVTLSWSPVASATGYELYYGVASNEYVGSVVLDTSSLMIIPGVPDGTYYLALVTHSGANVSSFSNELSININTFGSEFPSSSKTVGLSGGILEFADGIVFDVPAGALSQETTLTVRKINVDEVDPIFAARAYASNEKTTLAAFSAEPSGLVFNLPVTVSLPVPPLDIDDAVVHAELQLDNADYWLSETNITSVPDEGVVELQINSLSEHSAAKIKLPPDGLQAFDSNGSALAADAVCRTGVVRSESTFLDFSRGDQCLILSSTLATTFLSCPGSPTERHLVTEISRACGPNFRLNLSDMRPGEITIGDPATKLETTVEAQFSDGSTRTVDETLALSWTSLNPDILDVDIAGNAIGRAPGTARVRVSASDRFYTEGEIVVSEATQEPPSSGELSVELTSATCSITQVATYSYRFELEASGTASGSVDTRFRFNWSENPGINIESCGVWTFRESQQDCIRGPNDPPTTTWTGSDAVNLPLASVTFNEPRQITPFVNAGGSLGSTHPANLELDPFTVACQQ